MILSGLGILLSSRSVSSIEPRPSPPPMIRIVVTAEEILLTAANFSSMGMPVAKIF